MESSACAVHLQPPFLPSHRADDSEKADEVVEESSVENELKKYHELPQIPLKADSDVGAWW